MKDVDKKFWHRMQSQQHKRRNISGIYIFDKFPDEEKRLPTCIEDCQQTTRTMKEIEDLLKSRGFEWGFKKGGEK